MKYIKTYENNEVNDIEIKKLFKELKYHDTKHREIDEKLADICRAKIKPFMDASDPVKAKEVYYSFYKDIYSDDTENRGMSIDFSFEKDMVLMQINKLLRIKQDQSKFNL